MQAIWNDVVIADSNDTILIEGNEHFPLSAVNQDYLEKSNTHTTCPWKGKASYYNLKVDGATNADAAWYYPEPKAAAAEIKDYVAFWKGVQVK